MSVSWPVSRPNSSGTPRTLQEPTARSATPYGWGFARGVSKAFQEQEEQHQEWGLVMVVPQAVDDSMADMGKKTQFGTERTGGWRDAYRTLGFQDGRRFDPASRLSGGVPGQLMIGG